MTSGPDLSLLAAGASRRIGRLLRRGRAPLAALVAGKDDRPGQPLFIHFGTHKTGSSSIQDTLYGNSGARFGYDYPDLGNPNGSLAFSHCFFEPGTPVSRRLSADALGNPKRRERERGRLSALLSSAPRELPKVLSAEVITHFTEAELTEMERFLGQIWDDRVYIGYIREPVSFMRSVYQETLKNANPAHHIVDPDVPKAYYQVHAHEIVTRLERHVGAERVRAYAYDRSNFPGGDVVRHFLGAVGVADEGIRIHQSNDGLSLLAVKLLYLYRTRKAPRDTDIGHPRSKLPFVRSFARLGTETFQLHPDLSARIVAANQPFYDWSARRLDRPLLPPADPGSGGIRVASDLEHLSDAELGLLSDHLAGFGLALPAHPGSEAVAEAIHALRLHFAKGSKPRDQAGGRTGKRPARAAAGETAPPAPVPTAPPPGPEAASAAARPPVSADPRAAVRPAVQPAAQAVARRRLFLHLAIDRTGADPFRPFLDRNLARLAAEGLTVAVQPRPGGARPEADPQAVLVPRNWIAAPPESWLPRLAGQTGRAAVVSVDAVPAPDRDTALRFAAQIGRVFDVRVILPLRRIDAAILAAYVQGVLAGSQRMTLDDALPGLFERLRADRTLALWAEAFGAEKLMLPLLDRPAHPGGASLGELCAAIGLPWPGRYALPKGDPGIRLGRAGLEFKRCLNVAIPDPAISARFNPALLDHAGDETEGAGEGAGKGDLLPGAVRRMLIARQQTLFREIVPALPGLDEAAPSGADLSPDRLDWTPLDLSAEAFAAVGAAVLTPDLKTLLSEQIADARRAGDPQRLVYAGRFASLL